MDSWNHYTDRRGSADGPPHWERRGQDQNRGRYACLFWLGRPVTYLWLEGPVCGRRGRIFVAVSLVGSRALKMVQLRGIDFSSGAQHGTLGKNKAERLLHWDLGTCQPGTRKILSLIFEEVDNVQGTSKMVGHGMAHSTPYSTLVWIHLWYWDSF